MAIKQEAEGLCDSPARLLWTGAISSKTHPTRIRDQQFITRALLPMYPNAALSTTISTEPNYFLAHDEVRFIASVFTPTNRKYSNEEKTRPAPNLINPVFSARHLMSQSFFIQKALLVGKSFIYTYVIRSKFSPNAV